ncbi:MULTISPECIES: FAD:protein FMN transferase [Brucella/Ochrobactrum group]|uniref:FAD:protein FMN transferase n=1 Tax=Brucella/Ochrobactrum group TaxID=2826938 RepID=UPI00178C2664|nr:MULTISPECIES: FAD:protein FMN transferase [Brucella/Ochrobactrum group]MCQ9147148.1 FAD:protein FMN transferase [Ochrobactrum sp. BTU2]
MKTRRDILLGLGGLAGLMSMASFAWADAGDLVRISGRAFGTRWQVTVPADADAGGLGADLRKILAGIDQSMSPFRADSELSQFNHRSSTAPFAVSVPFRTVAGKALEIARLTDGAFDPGVGPDVHRYGFGPIASGQSGPHIAFALGAEGLSKAEPELSLDLCGIAKGYAVDRLAEHLAAQGVLGFLIEVGGEVSARGRRPDGAPWRVGIADPLRTGIHTALPLTDMAMATSGDAINAYEIAGRRYSHTIDPATREPVHNSVASVSVLAPTALEADAFATALLVMGSERGLAFATANRLPVLYLLRQGDGIEARANRLFVDHGRA